MLDIVMYMLGNNRVRLLYCMRFGKYLNFLSYLGIILEQFKIHSNIVRTL